MERTLSAFVGLFGWDFSRVRPIASCRFRPVLLLNEFPGIAGRAVVVLGPDYPIACVPIDTVSIISS